MLKRQLKVFIIVGLLTVFIDFGIYQIILSSNIINTEYAKAIGFASGIVFSFLVNKNWTFEQKTFSGFECVKFFCLYFSSCFINVSVNTMLIKHIKNNLAVIIAFILATAVSTVINFIGMKWVVFKSHGIRETA